MQIDPSGVPDCRVFDGVRDVINSKPAQGPTVRVPAELKQECPPLPMTDGSPANPRASRLKMPREMPRRERHNAC